MLLPERASRQQLDVPVGPKFGSFVTALVHDFVLASRSDTTWKAYAAWVECFQAWLVRYGVPLQPSQELWDAWLVVLICSTAILALSYSTGTLDVYVAAVSAYMQDSGLESPFSNRVFKMVMEGIKRWKGLGKHKKPGVEAKHVAAMLQMDRPAAFTVLQWVQARAILVIGWQMFCRAQDFRELQMCDVVVQSEGLAITVRYAKNDVKGLTRRAFLEATGGLECPKRLWLEYVAMCGLSGSEHCDKVQGEPTRCTACGPAFPSVHRRGVQGFAIPKSRVSRIIKQVHQELGSVMGWGRSWGDPYSAKSLRCGGVTEAAGACVRDGVLQGHGGWLQRQSLVHYDLMKDDERLVVSGTLNGLVREYLGKQ